MTIQLPPYGRAVRLLGWAVVFAIASHGAGRVEAVDIDFWAVMSSVEDVTMYKGLADSFNEETGITVKITPLGWGDYQTKYFAAMAAGLPPDVGVTNLGGAVDYGIVGGTLDLLRAFPGEAEELAGSIFPSLHAQNSFRGKLFGLPTELITNAIYYRTDIFAKLGIGLPPVNWSMSYESLQAR